MLTKAFVLPTDFFAGVFVPVEAAGLMEGKVLVLLERAGEERLLGGDEGAKTFFAEGTGLVSGAFTAGDLGDGEEDMEF